MNKWLLSLVENSQPWLMDPTRVHMWLARVAQCNVGPQLSQLAVSAKPQMRIEGTTAIIPISGVLLKEVEDWMRFYGFDVTGYDEIRTMVAAAVAHPSVTAITLAVDSPGGQVAGGIEAAVTIAQANKAKPVTAVVGELAASGAYWLASQAGRIEAGPNSGIGSIGVYTVYYDYSKMAEMIGVKTVVIKAGEHKAMGVEGSPITEAQIAGVQQLIDDIAVHFRQAVSAGRKMEMDKVASLATGQLWLAPRALELGLIDAVVTAQADGNGAATAAASNENPKGEPMNIEETKKAQDEAVAAERQRAADLKAAFPKDPAYALEATEKGLTVTEAKATYLDRIQAAGGTDKGPGFGESGTDGVDFMTEARKVSREQKISMTAAMKQVIEEHPGAYDRFRDAEQKRAVAVHSNKTAGRVAVK
jgi:protease IV